MLAPLRRCVDGWPCMVSDLRGRKMRTGSKIENPSTVSDAPSRSASSHCGSGGMARNGGLRKRRAKILLTPPGPPVSYKAHTLT